MCGIAGFTDLKGVVCPDVAARIVAGLHHRGPDQHGTYRGRVATLCAVRLKIIDLLGGDQPILSSDSNTVIAFNGEIYNHREIRRELEAAGHRFRSQCDTETVLHAFIEWDVECFRRMRGMFAAALWVESEQRLVLARDRMGIKPLYYFRNGEDVYFGSELKAILEHRHVPRRLDLQALDSFLTVNYVPGPQTLIEGIRKVPPGHLLEWRNGEVEVKRLEARGGVIVTQKEQTATGDTGLFDMKTNTVTLTGNVVMTQGKNVLRGERLMVDLTSGVSRVEAGKNGQGRVQGLFMPGSAGDLKPGNAQGPKPIPVRPFN